MVEALERFAPLPLQESWDNSGLQIGLTEADVSGVLLCLDVTEQIIDEAVRRGCNMVVSHHPLLFRGLKQVSDLTDVQRTVRSAIRHDVCVVSMHTCLDNAHGGVNTRIAERLAMPLKEGEQPQIAEMGGDTKPGQWVMLTLRQPMAARDFVLHVKRQLEAADAGMQFSHTLEEQINGQLEAGFTLLALYEDTNGEGRLHELNVPTFLAMLAEKRT